MWCISGKDNKMCAGLTVYKSCTLKRCSDNKFLTESVFIGLLLKVLQLSLAFLHRFHPFCQF